MKRIVTILLCFAMLFVLLGCQEKQDAYTPTGNGLTYDEDFEGETVPPPQEEDQTLTLAYYAERTMNPYTCTDYTNRALFSLVYQSLFVTGRDYISEPMLCKQYSVSEDMLVHTIYLEKATFSDGSLLTAEDVLASLQEARRSSFYGGRFSYFRDISITEAGAIQITLGTAYENLAILLDIPIIKASQLEEDRPLGTGPYVLEETETASCLRRRTNWWCDPDMAVTAETIDLYRAESVIGIRDEFEFGEVGLVCADPGSDRYADYRCDYELWDCENGIFLYLAFSRDSKVFADPKVRAALTYAIDRDTLVKDYYRGFAHSATLPASPLSPYYNVSLADRYMYDSIKFAQVVENAGIKGYNVVLLVNKDDTLRLRAARAIGKMLEDCGLVVEMKEMSGSNYTYSVQTRAFDIYLGQTKLSPNMDLSAFFNPYGELSYGGVDEPGAYNLCHQALENHGNYYTLHRTVMDNGLLCPVLFRSYAVYATRGLITGLTPSRDNVFYYSLGKTMDSVKVNP